MFKELAPFLRQRAVLLTVTHLEHDQIRVNVVPKKLKDGENEALTTALSVTGTAEELDQELPGTLTSYVAAHLQLKNTLENAKAEMEAAAKAAQAEARAKSKTPGKKDLPNQTNSKTSEAIKPAEPPKPAVPKSSSLFDMGPAPTSSPTMIPAAPASAASDSQAESSEEDDILAEIDDESEVLEDAA
jgi:PRTRC genetic system protein E